MWNTGVGRFRMVGFVEGLSFLVLLLIAMPLKYMAGFPQAVSVVGMIHGVLFVAYVILAIQLTFVENWGFKLLLILLIASLIPLGTFYTDYRYLRAEGSRTRK
jgi:integral membrane protein